MKIVFTGPEDVRILAHDDLERHSAIDDFKKTVFVKGQPKEVDDEVGIALTTQTDIYGAFEEYVVGERPSVTKSEEAVKLEEEAANKNTTKAAGSGQKTTATNTASSTSRS